MGRGKVQLKRIEDNNSRQVTFTKRRNGLIKKAKELAVLCDVDLALLIFSAKGRLSEFSSGDSMKSIIERYRLRVEEEDAVRRTINHEDQNPAAEFSDGPALLEMVQRQLEEENMDKLTVAELIQLELQLDDMLRLTRHRKTQIMCEAVTALKEQERQLRLENELMQMEIAVAAVNEEEAYVTAEEEAAAAAAAAAVGGGGGGGEEATPSNSDEMATTQQKDKMLAFL